MTDESSEQRPSGARQFAAAIASEPDNALMERLVLMDNPSNSGDECFGSLNTVVYEAVAWIGFALLVWLFVAMMLG